MAHGYLSSNENSGMEEEEKGGEYFNYLASRCFFQDFLNDYNGNIIACKMHDMVHDFVQYLKKEEIVAVEVDKNKNGMMDVSSKKAHHLRVKIAEGDQFPVSIKGIEKLRSLVVDSEECDVTGEALQAFFKGAKCLRLLDFVMEGSSFVNVKEIPNEIGKLIHLRYLNLSGSVNLKELPEGVCELHNLQFLNLGNCYGLEKLPDGMGKLINLRYFNSSNCYRLQYYPKGIGRLTSLRELHIIRARVDGKDAAKEFSVGDLENLDDLRGYLSIDLVGNVVDVEEVRRAKLHNKIHLDRLFLYFTRRGEINPNDIIQALNLPPSFDISVGEGLIRYGNFSFDPGSKFVYFYALDLENVTAVKINGTVKGKLTFVNWSLEFLVQKENLTFLGNLVASVLHSSSSREGRWRQNSSSGDSHYGHPQLSYGQESQSYVPHHSYASPQYHPPSQQEPRYYPHSQDHGSDKRTLDSRYSRIADNYKPEPESNRN
ncbi:putative disease resistance protein RGA3 [Durio zibethinus]|uniref:Disease resistance protein RGA3 n=1 Tax=Durio zibethinus TaxID=66656 RepID=A0A6P6BEI9_DURZI|nr:putative disease resistance protein RGA3 [Durio zibethinus]